VKAVQRMLGHASAQMALDRYSHLYDDDLEDLADAMDARYRAAQDRIEWSYTHAERGKKGYLNRCLYTSSPRSSGDRAPVS
jgi:integrase